MRRANAGSPLKQRSVTGTQGAPLPFGVLPTRGGAAGYRTLERAPASRAPVVRTTRNIMASPFQVGPNASPTTSSPFGAPVVPASGREAGARARARKAKMLARKKGA